ncbi:RNA-directed DNA polymerase from mobile element jockey [Trichonephila clavipes]|nr:RNA-directed DNA polymerase from mobile element jockey [Trichonephila clavipes]
MKLNPKNERPIKVVLKGLPRNFKVEEIQADLEELGFTPENLINPNQYGFTNKLSTLHPLLRLTESISEGFQKRRASGVVFLDIQKAFDRVWILGLTFKLITYDIPSPLIHLIHSYLTNRSFRIRVPKNRLSSTVIRSLMKELPCKLQYDWSRPINAESGRGNRLGRSGNKRPGTRRS